MTHTIHHPIRVAVVGTGNVGATFAYALLQSGLAGEIVLIDANKEKAKGEAMDLNHAMPLAHPTHIWSGTYKDCAGAAVTVLTAGTAQKTGESRMDLLGRNYAIFQQIVPEVVKYNPDGLLLVATNPVDVLTYATWKLSGLPAPRVIGSGTILDTARFRYLISQTFDVDAQSVHAYIIGEHGDSEVPVWSLANIAGMHIQEYCTTLGEKCPDHALENIFQQTRDAAYNIIKLKGATYYAVANGLLQIVEAVIRDQGTVLSVSTLIQNYYGIEDVYLSLPSVIGLKGVESFMRLQLSQQEEELLRKSAGMLRDTQRQLGL
ncbi:MAG: L-lactate dehydrogenase [Anaerolineaceae bacterium]|jgi:L-lactate dehydrogenase